MHKAELLLMVQMYTRILEDINMMLADMIGHENSQLYVDICNLGNDVSQKLAESEDELKYA